MTLDSRQIGALPKTIVTAGNPIPFPTAPKLGATAGVQYYTAIIRPLTADVVLDGVQLKYDTVNPPGVGYDNLAVSVGAEIVGVLSGTVNAGTVEVFFTTGI